MHQCIYIGVVYDLFKLFLHEGAAMAVLLEIVSVHVLELCVNFSFAIQIWQSNFFKCGQYYLSLPAYLRHLPVKFRNTQKQTINCKVEITIHGDVVYLLAI